MKSKLFTRRFQKDNQDVLCDSYIYIYVCNKDSMHLILNISIKWSFWAIRIKSAFLKNKNINNGF